MGIAYLSQHIQSFHAFPNAPLFRSHKHIIISLQSVIVRQRKASELLKKNFQIDASLVIDDESTTRFSGQGHVIIYEPKKANAFIVKRDEWVVVVVSAESSLIKQCFQFK